MRVGFTGTRQGMTPEQLKAVKGLLVGFLLSPVGGELWLDHGDCVGSDAEAHELATQLGYWIRVHPPGNPLYRAYCDGVMIKEKPQMYSVRNANIIRDADVVIATPSGYEEIMRGSGTWLTIRMAKRKKKKLIIVYPDGRTENK